MVFPPNHDRSPQPLNCIVVDDSLIFRKVVRDCLKQMPNITVIDIAADGLKAIDKITEHRPDLVTLDVEMPGKDGLEVLKAIRERGIDCDVIMVSGQTDRGADVTTKALSLGAFDFVLKPNANDPESNMRELLAALVPKIDAIRKRRRRRIESSTSTSTVDKTAIGPSWAVRRDNPILAGSAFNNAVTGNETASSKVTPKPRPRCNTADVIVIGVSTGGPSALREILPKLPANFPLPVLIVQHMPPLFTASLARDLNEFCAVTVCEAQHRQLIRPGTVYIAPGGAQMRVAGLAGCRHIEITDDPPIRACKPSVDYLFSSVADTYGGNCLAIILTGMGNDGTAGSRQLHACGARIVAQDEASCTVFGMPRQVIDAGLADRIETLHQIPSLMSRIAGQGAMVCL